MNKSKLVALFLFSILLLPLLSCGSRHDADEKYYLISANLQVPYWKTAGAGFMQAASQLKVRAEFAGPDSYDAKAQQQSFQQAVQQKATGILISVADPKLMKDDIDRAIGAGIPVITMDSDAPLSKRLFFIGTNNYQAGLMGGQRLVQELKNKGNVVVFTMPSQANMEERLRGYRDGLEKNTQIKIVRVVDIQGDIGQASGEQRADHLGDAVRAGRVDGDLGQVAQDPVVVVFTVAGQRSGEVLHHVGGLEEADNRLAHAPHANARSCKAGSRTYRHARKAPIRQKRDGDARARHLLRAYPCAGPVPHVDDRKIRELRSGRPGRHPAHPPAPLPTLWNVTPFRSFQGLRRSFLHPGRIRMGQWSVSAIRFTIGRILDWCAACPPRKCRLDRWNWRGWWAAAGSVWQRNPDTAPMRWVFSYTRIAAEWRIVWQ